MEATLRYKVSEIFTRYNFSKEDANFLTDVLNEIDEHQVKKFDINKELFLTQKDKVELIEKVSDSEAKLSDKINTLNRSVYIVGLVQFLAIVASVPAIINFMLK